MPPSQVKRSSARRRPPTPSQTARPSRNNSRVTASAAFEREAPGRADDAVREFAFVGAGIHLRLAGHIQTAGLPVATEILPEVGQLQRRAERVRRAIERVVAMAGDAQHEASDGIGRSTAVVEHVRPRSVPIRHGILTERADEIVEELERQVERSNRMRDRREDQVAPVHLVHLVRRLDVGLGRWPGSDGEVQAALPRGQVALAFAGRRRAFVSDVVGHAGKRVEGGHVRPHRPRQEP